VGLAGFQGMAFQRSVPVPAAQEVAALVRGTRRSSCYRETPVPGAQEGGSFVVVVVVYALAVIVA